MKQGVESLSDQEIEERLRRIEAAVPYTADFGFLGVQVTKRVLEAVSELAAEEHELEEERAQRKFERRLAKAKERGKA